jgi:hypothetical protein
MTTYGNDPLGTTTGTDPLNEPLGTDTGATGFGATDTGSAGFRTDTSSGDTSAKDKAKETASTATDEAANVAGTAAEQARNVIGDARQQVTTQVNEQATTQRDKLSETLRTLGDDLQQMAQGQGPAQGMATDLAREVSDRVRALGSHLENREPTQLLDDARDFARRRPGTFLVGALAAGVVAGRLFRATADGAAAASLAEHNDPADSVPGVGPTGAQPTVPTTPNTWVDTTHQPAPGTTVPDATSVIPGQRPQDLP